MDLLSFHSYQSFAWYWNIDPHSHGFLFTPLSAALLANGNGLCSRLPEWIWYSLDGEELGWGPISPGSVSRKVKKRDFFQKKHCISWVFRAKVKWVSFFFLCRESIYRLLPQTTPENIAKNFDLYTIDPSSRYTNLNSTCVRPNQVGGSFRFKFKLVCKTSQMTWVWVLSFLPDLGAPPVHHWRAQSLLFGACCYHTTAY